MNSWSSLKIVFFVIFGVALGAITLSIWAFSPTAVVNEIAVLYPSTSQDSWSEFLDGARLVAERRKLPIVEDIESRSITLKTTPVVTRFTWYPALGSTGIRARVREICQRKNPPLAIIGSDNSSLTEVIGSEIVSASRADWRPPLLMTWATADGLIRLNENRSYRFGFNNRYQALEVVHRLADEDGRPSASPVQAAIVQVLDNPFSLDLAKNFEVALGEKLKVEWIRPESEFREKGKGAEVAWSLRTVAGGMESGSQEEIRLVESILKRFRGTEDAPLVLVLPVDRESFERISRLVQDRLKARPGSGGLGNRLTILTGDTLGYYAFADASGDQMDPRFVPARVIFFSHVNPLDRTISEKPHRRIPSVGLHRDLVDILLDVIPELGVRATPEVLCERLNGLRQGNESVFERGERRFGGHALVAVPNPEKGSFAISLPKEWLSP